MKTINKKQIIFLILILFFLSAIGVLAFKSLNKDENPQINDTKTSITPDPAELEYRIVEAKPDDEEKNVPVDTVIEIVFNKDVNPDELEFSIAPKIEFELDYEGNVLYVYPKNNFVTGTKYTYIIKYKAQALPSRTYSFITEGEFKSLPDTQPEGGFEEQEDYVRLNKPDIYLTNKTPFTSPTFIVQSTYVEGNPGHFRFTVIQKTATGKSAFLEWLKSLKLTEEQISHLDTVLIMTDTIQTGASLDPLTRALTKEPVKFDIATLRLIGGDIEARKGKLEEHLGGNMVYGDIGRPDIYNTPRLSGVTKDRLELHSRSITEGMAEEFVEKSEQRVATAVEYVEGMAERLAAEFEQKEVS